MRSTISGWPTTPPSSCMGTMAGSWGSMAAGRCGITLLFSPAQPAPSLCAVTARSLHSHGAVTAHMSIHMSRHVSATHTYTCFFAHAYTRVYTHVSGPADYPCMPDVVTALPLHCHCTRYCAATAKELHMSAHTPGHVSRHHAPTHMSVRMPMHLPMHSLRSHLPI